MGKLLDANIVHNQDFENAILAVSSGEKLHRSQKLLLANFGPNVEVIDDSRNEETSFAQKILSNAIKQAKFLANGFHQLQADVSVALVWPKRYFHHNEAACVQFTWKDLCF